jgi:hypothetical protein
MLAFSRGGQINNKNKRTIPNGPRINPICLKLHLLARRTGQLSQVVNNCANCQPLNSSVQCRRLRVTLESSLVTASGVSARCTIRLIARAGVLSTSADERDPTCQSSGEVIRYHPRGGSLRSFARISVVPENRIRMADDLALDRPWDTIALILPAIVNAPAKS